MNRFLLLFAKPQQFLGRTKRERDLNSDLDKVVFQLGSQLIIGSDKTTAGRIPRALVDLCFINVKAS